jgi:hypothetical protein
MSIIYKYPFKINEIDFTEIEMPIGAIILDIQMQNNECVLWAIVDINHACEKRKFVSIMTGHEFNYSYGMIHIKTFIHHTGLVFHIFEDQR